MLSPVLITAPDDTPVSLAEAKAHCRVDSDDDDALLTALVQAATEHLDGWSGILGRCLSTQTWRQDFGGFRSTLRLPLEPVKSITSVTYYDSDNEQQTLAPSVYTLLKDPLSSYVTLAPDQEWPSTYGRADAVSVTFVAGDAVSGVPQPIKLAMLLLIGHWYENREAVNIGNIVTQIPMTVAALISPFRRIGL